MGRSPWARQIRCTELTLSPLAAAIAGAVQWVTPSGGASSSVRITTPSTAAFSNGGMHDGRVLSCSRPSTPSAMNRSCHRHTHGFDMPDRRITSAVPQPSPLARIIRARQTNIAGCCGPPRSPGAASDRRR